MEYFAHWRYEIIVNLTELMTWKLSSWMQGPLLNLEPVEDEVVFLLIECERVVW